MTQPAPDDVDVDSGFEEMDGGRVAKQVRTHAPTGSGVVEVASVTPDNLVDAEAGERSTTG